MSTPAATRFGSLPIAAALWLMLVLVTLVGRPVLPIEDRVLSAAWEMWLRQDYLVPYLNGEPYPHKPPLFYWIITLGWKLFGVNEWWPRLVPALFALGCLVLARMLALRLWPERRDAADLAPVILIGTVFWAAIATTVMYDVLLAFFVLAGALGLVRAWRGQVVAGFAVYGVAIGLGILSKGPVAVLHLAIPVLIAPLWTGTHAPHWGRWYLGFAGGVVLGLAVAGAWAIPAALAGGEAYARAILWGQTTERVVTSFAHRHPFWWYLPLLPLMLFPWIVWPALWRAAARMVRAPLDSGSRLLLWWSAIGLLAFSAISGKQPHYLLPLIPALVLLAARASSELPAAGTRDRWPPALAFVLFGALLVAVRFGGQRVTLPEWSSQVPLATGIAIAGVGVAMVIVAFRSLRAEAGKLSAACALGMVLFVAGISGPVWNAYDLRAPAAWIKGLEARGVPVANVGVYYGQYQFLGRLEKPLEVVDPADLPAWFARHPDGRAIVYLKPDDSLAGRAEFSQPYRGKTLAIIDSQQSRGALAPQ